MWVNKQLFDMIVQDNKNMRDRITGLASQVASLNQLRIDLYAQHGKDTLSIDWLRNRVNALEKQNSVLMQKAAGIAMPVPEIVMAQPGTIAGAPNFDTMPSFEDVGDYEAKRLGISHDDAGYLNFSEKN